MFHQRHFFLLLVVLCAFLMTAGAGFAQRAPVPRPSQKASVMQTIGVTEVSILYSRPAVKGRTIWGDWPTDVKGEATLDDSRSRPEGAPLVPWGHVWRAGANEATLFSVDTDVLINGQPLAAGKYSFHTIPGKDEWTIIFNKDDGQWGSFSYDAAKDALRVKTKPLASSHPHEYLTYDIDGVTEKSATVNLMWEKVKVPFTVEVKDVNAATIAKLKAFTAAAPSDNYSAPFQAAGWARQNKQMELAQQWAEQALKAADESIKAKPSFQNLAARANILLALGRKDEAIAASDKAITQGKTDKADTAAFEKRFADVKAGKL